jgi:hypothetical protein
MQKVVDVIGVASTDAYEAMPRWLLGRRSCAMARLGSGRHLNILRAPPPKLPLYEKTCSEDSAGDVDFSATA